MNRVCSRKRGYGAVRFYHETRECIKNRSKGLICELCVCLVNTDMVQCDFTTRFASASRSVGIEMERDRLITDGLRKMIVLYDSAAGECLCTHFVIQLFFRFCRDV